MNHHILIPLDGSVLAEGVLPHAIALGKVFKSRITLLHIIEPLTPWEEKEVIDPLEWQLIKAEASNYIESKAKQLKSIYKQVDYVLAEGKAAEKIIEIGNELDVDLIALSSHGKSGLSEWNISSVVQKIIMRSKKSILLIPAYISPHLQDLNLEYKHIMVPLDCSQRAEYVLQIASNLARFFKANLLLSHIIQLPEFFCRIPNSTEDQKLINKVTKRQEEVVGDYFEQLQTQMSLAGIDFSTHVSSRTDVIAALLELTDQKNIDLVVVTAHGHSGGSRYPYGSITTNLIVYGSTSLLIIQDLKPDDIELSEAELIAIEKKGR